MNNMLKKALLVAVVAALVAGCGGVNLAPVVEPRTALPALSEAADQQLVFCPGGPIVRAGFDPEGEQYKLMFFGPVDGNGEPAYPHIWMRFEGSTPVAILLVVAKDKMKMITVDELQRLYPSPCHLAGTPV